MNNQVAGRFPVIIRSYRPCVQSPSEDGMNDVVGIPPNIEPVHLAGPSGWEAFHTEASLDIPLKPVMSLWLTIFPESTSGTNAYASTRKNATMPA